MIGRFAGRGFAFALELTGLLVIVMIAGAVALMLRLQQGPLQIDFLTERVEKAFAEYQNGFAFDIKSTQLTWGSATDPFVLEMDDLRITRSDTTPVAIVKRARVVLSKRGLLLGHIVPKEFYLSSPVLRVLRNLDGGVSLNVGEGALPTKAAVEQAWADTTERPVDPGQAARQQFVAGLVRQMENPDFGGILGGLQRIVIDNAAVAYEDRVLGVFWKAEHAKIVVAREAAGVVADTVFRADFSGGADAAETAVIRLRVTHARGADYTGVEAFFANLDPSKIVSNNEKLAELRGLEMPLKGQISVTLGQDMRPGEIAFVIAGDAGRLSAFDLYPEPMDVTALVARGRYDTTTGYGEIPEVKIDLGVAQAELALKIAPTDEGAVMAGRRIELDGVLTGMPLDALARYWSPKLAHDAQHWVTTHLSKGIADRATIGMALVQGAEGGTHLERLGGEIDFHDITVDYFPPLEKVTGVTGRATYDADSFTLDITAGQLRDMRVTKALIDITELGHAHSADNHAEIDIAVSLSGPLKTALAVIDGPPLHYPSKLGLAAANVEGQADVDVAFAFPLYKGLHIEEVAVTARAKIVEARLPEVAMGQDLTGGPYDLSLEKGSLNIKGEGRLGASGVKLDWTKNFTDPQKPAMELTAQLTTPAASLKDFGVPEMLRGTGFLPARAAITERQDGTSTLILTGDLGPLGLSEETLGISKAEGEPGSLSFEMEMKNQRPVLIRKFSVEAPAVTASGSVNFSASGDVVITSADLNTVRFGGNDLSQVSVLLPPTPGAGYKATVRGRQLDASALFKEDDTPNSDEAAAVKAEPLDFDIIVDRLQTGKNRGLDAISLKLERNTYRRIERLEVDAVAGNKPLMVRYVPAMPAGKTLRVEAGNAGAALHALGITSAVQGGQLSLDAQPLVKAADPAATARDMTGTVVISNFETRDAPVLAKLLNALSLSGIRDLLNNKGLSFKKARARFTLTDRGQPAGVENQRLLRVADGQTAGASLGLTFEGAIDLWRKSYDLNGTIVPVSDLNKVLEKIPLLGDVLTAGGEGMFAATYKITGPQKDPAVSVNPLSVLAPGVLRKLFFEN